MHHILLKFNGDREIRFTWETFAAVMPDLR